MPKFYFTDVELAVLESLREQGCIVVMFTPDKIAPGSRQSIARDLYAKASYIIDSWTAPDSAIGQR